MTEDETETGTVAGTPTVGAAPWLHWPPGAPRPRLWRLSPAEVADLPAPDDPAWQWRNHAPRAPFGAALHAAALAAGALRAGRMPSPAWPAAGRIPRPGPVDLAARDALLGLAAECLAGNPSPWAHGAEALHLALAREGMPAGLPPHRRAALAGARLQPPWRAALAVLAEPAMERAVAMLAAVLLRPDELTPARWRRACAAAAVALSARHAPALHAWPGGTEAASGPPAPPARRGALCRAADVAVALAGWALVLWLLVSALRALWVAIVG